LGEFAAGFPTLRRRQFDAAQQFPISVSNPPLESNHSRCGWKDWGRVRLFVFFGELAMVPAQPMRNIQDTLEEFDVASFERDDFTDDDYSDDDIVSLLEENARLRKIVVRLSELVLRNVADAK
jgi:hypothetical protein